METTLASVFLIPSLAFLRSRAYTALGVCWMLLVLSRLDLLLFIVAPLAAFVVWRDRPPIRTVAALLGPAALAFLAYSAINYHFFHDFRPISGALKSTFPWPRPTPSVFLDPFTEAVDGKGLASLLIPNILLLSVASIAATTLAVSDRTLGKDRRFWLVLCAVSFVPVLNWCFFQKWDRGVEVWYLGVPTLVTSFVLGALVARRRWMHRGRAAATWAAAGALVVCGFYVLSAIRADRPPPSAGAVFQWMRDRPPGTVFAGTDVGAAAFFSGHPVVNLDGLVNDFGYQDRLVEPDGLNRYLRQMGVRYLIVGFAAQRPHELRHEKMWQSLARPDAMAGVSYGPVKFTVYSYLHGRFCDPVLLTQEREAFRNGGNVIYDISLLPS
jgi:hypothetical protein